MSRKPKNTEGLFLKKFSSTFIPLLLLIAVAVFFFWWRWAIDAVDSQATEISRTFVIKKGESLSAVAFRLQDEGLIRPGAAFKLMGRKENLEAKIQAGTFRLKPSQTLKEVIDLLTSGTQDIWLTFPEGWRQEEYARRLVHNLQDFNQVEFLSLAKNHEGELFPDTYLIAKEASAAAVFSLLQNNFFKKYTDDIKQKAQLSGLSQNEVLILASLVEREVKHDADRAVVAGILLKRLNADWPLQIDATLQYALSSANCRPTMTDCDWWVKPLAADKKIESPYNTYLHRGLPPTPICNPGLASIKAVVAPQDSEYWFYLSDAKGNMHYARSLEEHNANIQKYLQ